MLNDRHDAVAVSTGGPQEMGGALVELSGLGKNYGGVAAVRRLDLTVRRGELLAVLGPSGCGKTTLLKMIGGFVAPSSGAIRIAGVDVTAIGPDRRPTNMVFQGYGLFPHMTVAQNVAYGLRLLKRPAGEIAERVADALALVALDGFGGRPVTALSGGQQQRVALVRALIMRPQVLLLDEPLAALDLKLRKAMQEELRRIHRSIGGTFIFVTHDQEEAMGLANRIVVMERGSIVQDGTPEEIYTEPRTRFVSGFIGEANMLSGRREQGRVRVNGNLCFRDDGPDGPVVVMVRPEAARLAWGDVDDGGAEDVLSLTGTVQDVVFLGAVTRYAIAIGDDKIMHVTNPDEALRRRIAIGQTVRVCWPRRNQCVLAD